MSAVHTSTREEQEQAAELKQQVLDEIARRELTHQQLAGMLGLDERAIPNFLRRDWRLEEALRVARVLGKHVEITVS